MNARIPQPATLVAIARHGPDPDDRLAAVQLLSSLPPPAMTELLRERLESDGDPQMLWFCAGLLIDRYAEVCEARTALLGRLEHDRDPVIRFAVLQLLSSRFGASTHVIKAVARAAAHDTSPKVRTAAGATLDQLVELRFNPPPNA